MQGGCGPPREGWLKKATISSRELTPEIDAQEEWGRGASGAVDRLVLTFSELM